MSATDCTAAQLYSLLFGITPLVVGVLGFIVDPSASFGDGAISVSHGRRRRP